MLILYYLYIWLKTVENVSLHFRRLLMFLVLNWVLFEEILNSIQKTKPIYIWIVSVLFFMSSTMKSCRVYCTKMKQALKMLEFSMGNLSVPQRLCTAMRRKPAVLRKGFCSVKICLPLKYFVRKRNVSRFQWWRALLVMQKVCSALVNKIRNLCKVWTQ